MINVLETKKFIIANIDYSKSAIWCINHSKDSLCLKYHSKE